jgi:threonine dehydrogenase-like Zn-dependent dehydrogenase
VRATTLHAPFDIRLETVPEPQLLTATDAVVRVVASCICGSDLWPYRGDPAPPAPRRIGHEFIGVVEQIGEQVTTVQPGDLVIAPFLWSDGTCPMCLRGLQASCLHGGGYGAPDRAGLPVDGGQGEYVRVPQADGTLVAVPSGSGFGPGGVEPALQPSLLALSDVMGTGHHAALSARVGPGSTVAVVGDGAVGLCAVLASRRLGADQVIAMSRHPARQEIAREFGATGLVELRGDDGAAAVRELLGGIGADAVLECVGSKDSMDQAFATVRPGGTIGYVGVPHGVELPIRQMFGSNIAVAGGVAPVRAYLPELLADVLGGVIDPGRVFDLELPLDDVAEGYRAMHERRATKVLLRP